MSLVPRRSGSRPPKNPMPDLRARLLQAIENVRQASSDFDLNPDVVLPQERVLKPAAVLIAVTDDGNLVLTKRSAQLQHHAGQVAFPGGRMDASDRDLVHTARRETREEIGMPEDSIDVLGVLPAHETVTSYAVTPVVALVPSAHRYRADPNEVADVFHVPLDHVLSAGNYRIESRVWQGRQRYYYTVPYGPYFIWGATARILRSLAQGQDR